MRWYVVSVEGLGCFKCTSINHSNPECEDTFNNTDRFWEPDCWGTRKNRMGSFPGTQCIKMIAEDGTVGQESPENVHPAGLCH
nr:hypothetical protein BaRGS_013384 [Batillaria attramentaria]